MSTLRVTGLKQETSSATNISMAVGGGVTVAGIATFHNTGEFASGLRVTGGRASIGNFTDPKSPLHIRGEYVNQLPVSGVGTGSLVISNADTSYGMNFGVIPSTGNGWIQQTRVDNTAANYSLLLNPLGGSVGIGTNNPTALIHAQNNSVTDTKITIESTGTNSYPALRIINDARSYDLGIDGATDALRVYDVTGAAERLRITSNGEVTKPLQPLAIVGTSENNWAPSAGDDLPFNQVETDIGSNYNASTYKFTCPVAGNYMVILTHASTRWVGDVELRRDDVVIRTLELRSIGVNADGNADWASRSYSFIIPCTANQTLHWHCNQVFTSIGANPYLLDGQSTIGGVPVYTRYDSATYYLLG